MPPIGEVKDSVHFSSFKPVDLDVRPVVQVSLGCHVEGAAQPHPCPQDPQTMIAGVCKRFGMKPPDPDPALLAEFKVFVEDWLSKNFVPLSPDTDVSVETWLEQTNYPKWRKDELLEAWKKVDNIWDESKGYFKCKSFMKDETYPTYKHARGINSRSDEFKCFVGPLFKAIEKVVYEDKHFIKHVPVRDRPQFIYDLLYKTGAVYMATDYTAYESHFTLQIMQSCEFVLYDYMTQHLPQHEEFMRACQQVLGGRNVCEYKSFTVSLDATRMSGEMCTSLGNGFANLMIMLFVCMKNGNKDVDGVVEGDDGGFSMRGDPPTEADFAKLGFTIKIEVHQELSEMSFCGLIFDVEDKVNVTDPREVLATFGWSVRQYSRSSSAKKKALLRCKALSIAHQYPGCPILQALAFYALRATRSVMECEEEVLRFIERRRDLNMWEREQLISAARDMRSLKPIKVPMNTRFLVENKFNVTIEEQLKIEAYLDSKWELTPLSLPLIRDLMLPEWGDYWDKYVRPYPKNLADLERPVEYMVPRIRNGTNVCLRF